LTERMTGVVKWFDSSKGYGFIQPEIESVEEVFVHYTAIVDNGLRNLYEGDRVEFSVVDDPKGPQAINVVRRSNLMGSPSKSALKCQRSFS